MVKLAGVLLSLLMVASVVACTKAQPSTLSNTQVTSQYSNTPRSGPSSQSPRVTGSSNGRPGITTPEPSESTISQPVTVKGDGTIAVMNYANLYFGTGGKIEKINVKQGDSVLKGEVLAQLDTASLEAALAQAKVALDTAQIAQTQANISLQTNQMTLDKNGAVSDENDKITGIQLQIKAAQLLIQENLTAAFWTQHLTMYQQNLANETRNLSALLGQTDDVAANAYVISQYGALTVQDVKVLALQVQSAQQTVEGSQEAVNAAQSNLNLAQAQLNESTITAPFDGIIATLNYNEGSIVGNPSSTQLPVIYLVDPSSLAVNINVNELDVPQVKIGQPASVSINAFPGIILNGKVTAISPMPATQGSMVTYSVTVTLSVPSDIEIRAGMDATAKIAITAPGTQSTAPTQTVSSIKSVVPSSANGGTTITPPASAALSKSTAINSRGSVTALTYANLYFGTSGQIKKLSVKQGAQVVKGTVMANLDTTSLEAALAQAKVTLDQAQLANTQAITSLQAAQTTLNKTKLLAASKAEIINLQWQLTILPMDMLDPINTNGANNGQQTGSLYGQQIASLTTQINTEKKAFSTLLAQPEYTGVVTYDITNAKYDILTVEDINIKTLQVQLNQQTVAKTQDAVDQAQKNLNLAQEQLDEAVIKAPFNGLVANVNYNAGDILAAPSPAQQPVIYLVDPSTLAVIVGVNELDVPSINIGQPASISVDAFPGINLEGKVSAISAVPTLQGGIVDFNVTIILSIPPNVEVRKGMNASAQIKVN